MTKINKTQRRILLVEPNYRNKYPPLGLMKLAAYYRSRGDYVRFYKGNLRNLVVEELTAGAMQTFQDLDPNVAWQDYQPKIASYIKLGRKAIFQELIKLSKEYSASIGNWLKYFFKSYRSGNLDTIYKWDYICVSTLFTFYWKVTIETIQHCKSLVKDQKNLYVGGIMASVIPEEIEEATGIRPIVGLLDQAAMLDPGDETIIDELAPDYSILEEIDYQYPERDGYYGYLTRGCIRQCSFCAVSKLEPKYKEYISLADKVAKIDALYGARRNLLLLDNNVLASRKFSKLIAEVREIGFTPGAKFTEPNRLDFAIAKLKKEGDSLGYRKQAYRILSEFHKKLTGQTLETYQNNLEAEGIGGVELPSAKQLIAAYEQVAGLYEKRRNKIPRKRFVDFNQGVDARLLNDEKMALIATIPIKPLRIAFDSMSYARTYEKAIRSAAHHGINYLSNYILFNFEEKPIELYQRLRLNVELCTELNIQIYSFPMRYSPIWDDNGLHHGRTYVGKHWNRKFIRAVQAILNATKGKIGSKLNFFEAAFGRNEDEFFEILYMPEAYIMAREISEKQGYTKAWRSLLTSLTSTEVTNILPVIESNDFTSLNMSRFSSKSKLLIESYRLFFRDIVDNTEQVESIAQQAAKICATEKMDVDRIVPEPIAPSLVSVQQRTHQNHCKTKNQ